jgi:hypothetical protein
MTRPRKVLLGLLLLGSAWGVVQVPKDPPKDFSPQVRCAEDMPCWDCATMGNKVCGP